MKACFLSPMPSPYMEDFFNALSLAPDFEIQVFYEAMVMNNTHWGDRELPSYAKVLSKSRTGSSASEISSELGSVDADFYVVQGYSTMTQQAAIRWLRKQKKKWAFWGERPGVNRRGFLGRKLRDWALQPVLSSADAVVAIGELARQSYSQRLRRDIPVVNIPYLCTIDQFLEAGDARRERGAQEMEKPLTILYCGQLISRKGLDTLMRAFQRVLSENSQVRLRLIGTGEQQETLQSMLSESEQEFVDFAGFLPVDQLPEQFAAADLFVLPSRHDGWGVVVNQALATGLPLICSDSVGAAYDLI